MKYPKQNKRAELLANRQRIPYKPKDICLDNGVQLSVTRTTTYHWNRPIQIDLRVYGPGGKAQELVEKIFEWTKEEGNY